VAYLCKRRKTPEVIRMTVRLNHARTTNLQRYEVYVSLDEKKDRNCRVMK